VLGGCVEDPQRLPFGPEVFGTASEVTSFEIGDSARYEIRFVGTGMRGEQHAVMEMLVFEVEAPSETEVVGVTECAPYGAEQTWTGSAQSSRDGLATLEVEDAFVPFDIRCRLELQAPSAPLREGEDPVVVNIAWEATLEMLLDGPIDGELNARVDIDPVESF